MEHRMTLYEEPFHIIKNGAKKIEIRCYDDKRKEINIGDVIIFSKLPDQKEILKVKVTGLYPCKTFKELFERFDSSEFGHENYSIEDLLEGIRSIYSEERETEYGALGIRIEVI
jgi:ASC-1-like (ASCH) protein